MQRYHMKASHPVIDRVADSEGLYVLASEAFEALTASEARVKLLQDALQNFTLEIQHESAELSSVKFLRAHVKTLIHTEAVGDCVHCTLNYLIERFVEKDRILSALRALGDVTATQGEVNRE